MTITLGFICVLQYGLQYSSTCNKVIHFGAASDSLCSKLSVIPKLRPGNDCFIIWVLGLVMGPPMSHKLSLTLLVGSLSDSEATEAKPLSSSNILYELDPKIDKTLHRLRKVRSIVVSNNGSSNSNNSVSATNDSDFSKYSSSNINSDFNFGISKSQKPNRMENNDRVLKELTMLDVVYQPWCNWNPQLDPTQSYELKYDLIHLLPKFHGLASEDPHKHLNNFMWFVP
ncbi:hypothetical protein CR513_55301, partial [Mucuna pruriens]